MKKPARTLAALLALPLLANAQQPNLDSHQVNQDRTVTFRYYASAAKAVSVGLDYAYPGKPMAKGADGIWTLTTPPLQPALHQYYFQVDGTRILDPLNPLVEPTLQYLSNEVTVPGPSQLWDVTAVPHGVLHHHFYATAIMRGLPAGTEDFYVYTPPGYDPTAPKLYPTLYLLHGWSGEADSWCHGGQANLILDNLIAQQRVVPMIVVMPLGYGDYTFITGGAREWNDPSNVRRNTDLFGNALLTEILPQVEAQYRVSPKRDDRAIAGLSMGGAQSLVIGLNHPEAFAWVGGFSSAMLYPNYNEVFPHLDPRFAPRLLWVSCGRDDPMVGGINRRFAAWLTTTALHPLVITTPGIHNWPVWRDNLIHFAPLLFRPAGVKSGS